LPCSLVNQHAWFRMLSSVRCNQDGRLSGSVHAEATPLTKGSCHTPGGGGGLLGPIPLGLQRVGLAVFYTPKAIQPACTSRRYLSFDYKVGDRVGFSTHLA
jgi:hypothetical protein